MQIFVNKRGEDDCLIDILTNNIVGILLNRNISLLSTIYNCYKNRITYIPIDPNWPNERINAIVSANDLGIIITTEEYQDRISGPQTIVVEKDDNIKFTTQFPENEISYIIYTSGSTGEPKGVEVKRSSLLNFIDGVSEIIDFSLSKRIACLTTVTFDIFFSKA